MELSDETYFYDPEGEWMVSSETTQYRNSRVHVETILRQRLRGLRRVSYQLPCFNSILECAFEDSGGNACVRAGLSGVFGAHRRCPDELEVERCGSLQDIAADGGLELGAVVQLSAAWVVAATLSQRGLRGGQRPASHRILHLQRTPTM